MEDRLEAAAEGSIEVSLNSEMEKTVSAGSVKRTGIMAKPTVTTGITRKRIEPKVASPLSSTGARSTMAKSTVTKATASVTSRSLGPTPTTRRNSTGGLPEKQPVSVTSKLQNSVSSAGGRKSTSATSSEPLRRSLPEVQSSSLSSGVSKALSKPNISETRKSVPISPIGRTSRTLPNSVVGKNESAKHSAVKSSSTLSSSRSVSSMSLDSTGSSTMSRSVSKVYSPLSRSPSVSSGPKLRQTSSSRDKSSNLSGRRKVDTQESRDSRFIILPQIEIKVGDDVRLDLRGHRIRSLSASGLNLSSKLEFVYLRDNLLSTLEGIEILNRVKVCG